ncbi:unnamed protein product [Phytophthora fragariaefolia]|uniref:Unnamed protein product n=1 Tax=Phytophthora fragariaefolia TaxID=1490495 RepID=A0A9W6X1B6_9STRA|nr:unnamed protein product [Phytophthora fragariaefolia]
MASTRRHVQPYEGDTAVDEDHEQTETEREQQDEGDNEQDEGDDNGDAGSEADQRHEERQPRRHANTVMTVINAARQQLTTMTANLPSPTEHSEDDTNAPSPSLRDRTAPDRSLEATHETATPTTRTTRTTRTPRNSVQSPATQTRSARETTTSRSNEDVTTEVAPEVAAMAATLQQLTDTIARMQAALRPTRSERSERSPRNARNIRSTRISRGTRSSHDTRQRTRTPPDEPSDDGSSSSEDDDGHDHHHDHDDESSSSSDPDYNDSSPSDSSSEGSSSSDDDEGERRHEHRGRRGRRGHHEKRSRRHEKQPRRKNVKDLELPMFAPSPKVSVGAWIERVELALQGAKESGRGEWGDKALYFILGNKLIESAAMWWVNMDRRPHRKQRTWTYLKKALLRRFGEKLDTSTAEWRVSMRFMYPGETHADYAAALRDLVDRNKVKERVLLAQFYRGLEKGMRRLV